MILSADHIAGIDIDDYRLVVPEPFEQKDATDHTASLNAAEGTKLDFVTDDFELAGRGLLATHPTGVIDGSFGIPAWDLTAYEFLDGDEPPPSVHPSLWRQAKLNNIHGLFQVDEGLWQVRGYDISVISFIEGETGWIIIDPLTSTNTAKVALDLANNHLGERPVRAVIYTHSHTDHYGGARGVTTPEAVAAGEVEVIAPVGFLDEVVSESLIAGNPMIRRAFYQFGIFLPPGEKGQVDAGLGKAIVKDQAALIAPTREITTTGEELTVDGIRIVFQNTPNAEAPAEMNFFFPDKGWLCTSEICTHTMHNLIPFRGAKVRDSLAWSKYIHEAKELFGPNTKLVFASHHWPRWGAEAVAEFLTRQRDLYRWIHDQTMRLAATGLVASEIADQLEMPPEFLDESHTRGYYGSLVHNVKAVYQLYLSWYDGNPARLWPHPPEPAARRYVDYMGGAEAVLAKARDSYADGDYRWVAEVVNHVVFADPDNNDARALQADALEQLGYQSESATWRNAYLTGAMELRGAAPPVRPVHRKDTVEAITLEQLVDTMGVRLQSENVGGATVSVAIELTDSDEQGVIGLQNRALHFAFDNEAEPSSRIRCSKDTLVDLAITAVSFDDALALEGFECSLPDSARLIFDNLDTHYTGFNVVTP